MDKRSPPPTKLATVPIRELEDSGLPTPEVTAAVIDRRNRFRFAMNAELRYQVAGGGESDPIRGTGKVENISSKALAFRADGQLEPGMRLRVSVASPATLEVQCKLRLAFEGIILRTRGNLVVLAIQRPEFRTAGKITSSAREEIAAMATGNEELVASNFVRAAAGGDRRLNTPHGANWALSPLIPPHTGDLGHGTPHRAPARFPTCV